MEPLVNARGESFCEIHQDEYRDQCRVVDCPTASVPGTRACVDHQEMWKQYQDSHSRRNLLGIRRIISRPNEIYEWQNRQDPAVAPPHDQPQGDEDAGTRKHYFGPSKFYCVETACFPCGVVISWTKFDKAESPSKILGFLEETFPTPESRPSYICIDKACQVLRTAVVNGSFSTTWKDTRFIVDTYHYNNHKRSDELCKTWCNPTPENGSNPNLIVLERDNNGNLQAKRAFNTQASEQLNSWLASFNSILKRMTIDNFNWFLHTMLFLHSQNVIKKQRARASANHVEEEDLENEIEYVDL